MKARLALWAMVIATTLLATACGPKAENGGGGSAVSSATSDIPSVSRYDSGPRAGEADADETLAKQGETVFQAKGCSACHTFGRKLSGPDLQGVTMRRTALWMENQILHPEVMTKQDPIAHQLFAQFSLQMPNQGLTPDEARAVIEFLKHKDHEASEGQEAKKEDEK
jgi:mono/diheme cytochrome c family protein